MVISVSRIKDGVGLTLQTGKVPQKGKEHYEATIHPGESALGYTYAEWETALGSQEQRVVELEEDGALRPASAELDRPADNHT